jgi:predicted ArsR family transcriptional regulator
MAPLSRVSMAQRSGLSKQTISKIIEEFEEQDLVRQTGKTSGELGRTALLYEINASVDYVLGVHLGAHKITAALGDITSKIYGELDEPIDPRGGYHVLEQLVRLIERIGRENSVDPRKLRSIVLATPGVYDPKLGAIRYAPTIPDIGNVDM